MGTKVLTQEQADALKAQLQANPDVMRALGITLTESKEPSKKPSKKKAGKRKGKGAKKAAKSKGNTGPVCACGCKQRIPAQFEPGYHPKRTYTHECSARRAQERKVAKDEYKASDKYKRNQERKAAKASKQASKADETTAELASVPTGVKLDRNGYPLICEITGVLIPADCKYNTAASKEAHDKRAELRAAGKAVPYGRNEQRKLRKQFRPAQVHPQGDGSNKSKPERKRKGIKRQGKDSAEVPQQESAPEQTLDFPAEVAEAIRLARTKAGKARIVTYWERYGSKWAKKLRKHAQAARDAIELAKS